MGQNLDNFKIIKTIIINQIALNYNDELRHTKYFKHGLKQKINLLLPELIKCEKEYDEFYEKAEQGTSNIYDEYDQFIQSISSVPIWECKNIRLIIEAYKIDSKSIEGIVNKILK